MKIWVVSYAIGFWYILLGTHEDDGFLFNPMISNNYAIIVKIDYFYGYKNAEIWLPVIFFPKNDISAQSETKIEWVQGPTLHPLGVPVRVPIWT